MRCTVALSRKALGGLLLSAALTSMLTGITEPLEFTFLFVAPVVVTDSDAYQKIALEKTGPVKAGDAVLRMQ